VCCACLNVHYLSFTVCMCGGIEKVRRGMGPGQLQNPDHAGFVGCKYKIAYIRLGLAVLFGLGWAQAEESYCPWAHPGV